MDPRSSPLHASRRLSYERILQRHAAEFEPILCDPRVYQFIDCDCPTPADLEVSFMHKEAGAPPHRSDEQWLDYAVRLTGSGVAIGRLEATLLEGRAEVAYLFGPDFWGCGYATEALAWLHELIRTKFGVMDFWATVKPGNDRSVRLLERSNYREEPSHTWPRLTSYDPGDLVFRCRAGEDETSHRSRALAGK